MKRSRTYRYIPQRTVKTYDAADWRVNLVRCQHIEGAQPRYDLFVWNGYTVSAKHSDVGLPYAETLFDQLVDGVQLEIAKHALGIGRKSLQLVA